LEADDDGFGDYREKIAGIEVFDPWRNKFVTKHTHLNRKEILEYKTPLLIQALHVYKQFKACGCLFNGIRQNDERPAILQVLTLFDDWSNRMPSWIRENEKFL